MYSSNVKVSVIMPVHNRAKYLKEAVSSVFFQTLKEYELICVDDCSEETETIDYLNEIGEKYENVLVVRVDEPVGAGNARNIGFEYARGQYVMFLDSDDIFHANLLEKMYAAITEIDADIVFNGCRMFTETDGKKVFGKDVYLTNPNMMENRDSELWIHDMMKNPWSKMYRVEYLRRNNIIFQDLPSCNDVAFSVMANVLTDKYAYVTDEALVDYRLSSSQISSRRNPMNAYYAGIYIEMEMKNRGLLENDKIRHSFLVFFFLMCIGEMKLSKDVIGAKKLYEEMNQYFKANTVELREERSNAILRQYL